MKHVRRRSHKRGSSKASVKSKQRTTAQTRHKPKQHIKPWRLSSPAEKELRVRSLEVLRYMRSGKSLSFSAKYIGIDPRTVVKHYLRSCIYKRNGRWHARKSDKLERMLIIYEDGQTKTVSTKDSKTATVIGKYLNDTKKILSGDVGLLEKYKDMTIKDATGKLHHLEARLDMLKQIELSREDIEFGDIYDH